MKQGWEIKKLTEVVWFQEGPGVRKHQYTSSGVKLLNVANLVNGKVDLSTSDRYISSEEAYGKYKHFLVDEGDLILASSGIQVEYIEKKMGFIEKHHLPLCMNTSTIRFKSIDKNVLDITYFMYFLKSYCFKEQLFRLITGVAQLNYGPSHLKQMSIPVPPLTEQEKIVAELDCLSGIIEKKKQQLKEYDALAQSIFYEMFGNPIDNEKGWEVKKLGNVAKVLGGYAFKSTLFVDDGIPLLRIGNINSGVLKTSSIVFYQEDSALEKYIVYPNDLVMSLTGTVGKDDYGNVCVLDKTYPKYYLNQRNAKFVLSDNIVVDYMKYFLKDTQIKSQLTGVNRGVRQGNISNKDIEGLIVPIPPLALQQEFASKIEAIEKQKELIKQSIAETETLFNSRMEYYFN